MKLSVALAAYNGEKYIEEQLRSILQQTREVDEMIITDDGSTDRTLEIVLSFIEANHLQNRWKVMVNPTNLGYAENYRHAMDLCTGELIFLSDQDDIWVKDRVERMTEIMERQPEIGLLTSDYQVFHDGDTLSPMTNQIMDAERIPLNRHTRFLRSLGCVMCVRTEFYKKAKGMWYSGWAHDEFLWSAAVLFGCGYRTKYRSLYRRLHEKQVSGHLGHSKEKRIAYIKGAMDSSQVLLDECRRLKLPKKTERLYRNNVKAHRYRLDLVNDCKLSRAILVLPYVKYYYAPKSYLVELAMALRRTEGRDGE